MRSVFNFIIKPKDLRTSSKKSIGDKELILNTELQNHEYVSRHGVVLNTPLLTKTDVKIGDEVIVHHNVFRRFYDIRGEEKNSKSYFEEDKFFAYEDQVFLYKRKDQWRAIKGYCFVKPLLNTDNFELSKEHALKGVMVFPDRHLESNGVLKGDIVGFKPSSEYEFIIDNQKLYRVHTNSITIKYERQGNEKEYNPSWL